MADRLTDTAANEALEELRAYLAKELDDESLAAFDLAQDQWDSGALQRMIDSGDFSGIPDTVRPGE